MPRNPLAKLALLLGSSLLTLLALELALRLAGFQPLYAIYSKPELFWRYDVLLGWAHEPAQQGTFVGPRPYPVEFAGEVHINSLGLRGAELAPVPPGGLRLLVLGDSLVAGFEVDDHETFTAKLAGPLSEQLRVPVQTINAGVRGYGTDQSLLYYRQHGRALRSDLVLFHSASNDLEDNTTLHRARRPFGKGAFVLEADGGLRLVGTPVPSFDYCAGVQLDRALKPVTLDTPGTRAVCWAQTQLADRSALLTFVALRLQTNRALVQRLHEVGSPDLPRAALAPEVASAAPSPAGRLTTALLLALAREVQADGARFVLAISPPELALLDGAALSAAGITVFDTAQVDAEGEVELGPGLRYDPTLHFRNDRHLNARGHAREAAVLTPLLVRELSGVLALRPSSVHTP